MNSGVGDFDEFAADYETLLRRAVGRFAGQTDYYSSRKAELLKKQNLDQIPMRILDFGCGTGLLITELFKEFPNAEIWGTDVSKESLAIAKKANPTMNCVDPAEIVTEYFDLIVISNVLHHIEPSDRANVIRTQANHLRKGGAIFLFEHNKKNPITRRIVDRCEFDVGVELLTRKQSIDLINASKAYGNVNSGYFMIFPGFLKRMKGLEQVISRVPVGAQFWISAKKRM
jgi:SAM-dependent methyltransferase